MGINDFSLEMLGTVKTGMQDSIWNKIDEEVNIERWNNIGCTAQAMVESEVAEKQVLQMLMKYWDLRLSEAKEVYQFAVKNLSHD